MTVTGSAFGVGADLTAAARVGATASEATVWVSGALRARAPRRPAPPSRTDGTRLVPPPVLTGHVSSLLPARPPGSARARLTLRVPADTSVVASVPAGVSRTRPVFVTAGLVPGSLTEALSYDLHATSAVSGAKNNLPPADSTLMTITSMGLSPSRDISLVARAGATAAESSVWVSATSVVARFARGMLATKRVVVTAGTLTAGTLTEAWSFERPEFRGGVSLPANVPPPGASLSVTLTGYAFGSSDPTMAVRMVRPAFRARACCPPC